jgi:hypothetical protein
LQDEMRRVIATMGHEVKEWTDRSGWVGNGNMAPEYVEGRRAYALYQVSVRSKMAAECKKKWGCIPKEFLTGDGVILLTDNLSMDNLV